MNILITGAGKGLGYELCRLFLEEGHRLYPVVRTADSAKKINTELVGQCYPIIADLETDDSIKIIKDALEVRTDHLDLLINNAGIASRLPDFTIDRISTENLLSLFNIHCLGAVRTVIATKSLLLKSSKPLILNISSRLGSLQRMANKYNGSEEQSYAYRIAKASQNMFILSIDKELSSLGVTSFSIHPGKFISSTSHGQGEWEAEDAARNIIKWLDTIPDGETGKFVFPNNEEIPW